MLRTHLAGSLRAADAGTTVTLAGWVARRRDHGGVAFIDLRDASGLAQVVLREEIAHELRTEFVIQVTGEVRLRPEGSANANLASGEIEVVGAEVVILNTSAPTPFPIDEHVTVGEEARLKHRYLDLRRPAQRSALVLRSKANAAARRVLDRHDFLEIETPTLTRSTPGGRARLPGARAARARLLVRAAAVAAAVQAAAHGRRHGALLPDRPLLPR